MPNNTKPNFDDPEFDVIDYINKRFPNEQSLATIDKHISSVREMIRQHEEEISQAVRNQTIIDRDGRDELYKAASIITELMQRINDMKCQAKKSEQTVNDITCDIKQLDNAKRNLTSAITMLNNLNILVESIERLKMISAKNEYRQVACVLKSTQDVMSQFENFKYTPHISRLYDEVEVICRNLNERINLDFRRVFEVPRAKHSMSKDDIKLIAEACLVISLLDEGDREKLISWLLELQLTEYSALFKDSQLSMSSLNGVDKRYSWLKKHLLEFEEKYGFLFPPPWQMSERMAIEFCHKTRESLTRIMNANPSEVKLESFVFAMSKTTAFENLLTKRFVDQSSSNSDGNQEVEGNKVQKFAGIISSCFEPHSHVFIKAQEATIQKQIEQFIDEHQKAMKGANANHPSIVFHSSHKLFQQYKNSLIQCVQLSNKTLLLDLQEVFKRNLRDYAYKVLQMHLRSPGGRMFSISTNDTLFQSLLRADARRNKINPYQICSVTLTANYCYETTLQLEKKLKDTIDPSLGEQVNFESELNIFNDLLNGCVRLLTQHIKFNNESEFITNLKDIISPKYDIAEIAPKFLKLLRQLEFVRTL